MLIVRLKVSWLYKRYNLFKEIIDKSPSHEDYARLSDPLERGCIKRHENTKSMQKCQKHIIGNEMFSVMLDMYSVSYCI